MSADGEPETLEDFIGLLSLVDISRKVRKLATAIAEKKRLESKIKDLLKEIELAHKRIR